MFFRLMIFSLVFNLMTDGQILLYLPILFADPPDGIPDDEFRFIHDVILLRFLCSKQSMTYFAAAFPIMDFGCLTEVSFTSEIWAKCESS